MSELNYPVLAKEIGLGELVLKQLTPLQIGWIKLANLRKETFDNLLKGELKVQELLNTIEEDNDLLSVQNKLKEAKSIAATDKEQRLHFTGMLEEKIIKPAMEFEKRNLALITSSESHEFILRKKEKEKTEKEERKNKEAASLKSHFENEHLRIRANYKLALSKLIQEAYEVALTRKLKVKTELATYLDSIRTFIKETKLDKFQKYERAKVKNEKGEEVFLIDDNEATLIYKEVPVYNPIDDLAEALENLDLKFSMYSQDLKNAEKALEKSKEAARQKEEEIKEELEVETNVNNLSASAGSFTYGGNISGAKTTIKENLKLVEESSPEWLMNVLTAFITNFKPALEHIKVKSVSKLTIAQIGAALAKVKEEKGTVIMKGLTFEKKEK